MCKRQINVSLIPAQQSSLVSLFSMVNYKLPLLQLRLLWIGSVLTFRLYQLHLQLCSLPSHQTQLFQHTFLVDPESDLAFNCLKQLLTSL